MMKIPNSVRNRYDDKKELYKKLREEVGKIFTSIKENSWHYEGRIKELESFALKLETGRCIDPEQIEDFFACTIVVENLSSLPEAEKKIIECFDLVERRPPKDNFTHKQSNSFPFDDIRLYVKWNDLQSRPTELHGLLFEIQIKTFLQHAWSIATHDLVYKSDEKNWAKERIAYQVKAMLEHAELSILEADKLSRSNSLNKKDSQSKNISKIIKFLEESWDNSMLPDNKKLLAENINNLIRNLSIDLSILKKVIEEETKLARGCKTLNLSPYGIIVQSLLNQKPDLMSALLSAENSRFKVCLHKELDIPDSIDRFDNAVLL